MDVDSPLDLRAPRGARGAPGCPVRIDPSAALVRDRLAALRAVAADPGAELLVAGRTSRHRPALARAPHAVADPGPDRGAGPADVARPAPQLGRPNRRPPRSVLGELLERDGPGALGRHVAGLADGALLDSRVLLAHRLGADEARLADGRGPLRLRPPARGRIVDPWLRELTAAAARRAGPDPPRRARARRARRAAGASGVGEVEGPRSRTIDAMDDDRDRPVASLVREPLPDPESVGEDEVLVERSAPRSRAEGPITFARFMDRALYEPGHGYYRRPDPAPVAAGDFLTAPEAHPIFGARHRPAARGGVDGARAARTRSPSPSTAQAPARWSGACWSGFATWLAAVRRRSATARSRSSSRGSRRSGRGSPRPGSAAPARRATPRRDASRPRRGRRQRGARRAARPPRRRPPDAAASASCSSASTPRARSHGSRRTRRRRSSPTASRAEGVELADGQVTEVCLALDELARGRRRRPRPRGRRPRRLRGGARGPLRTRRPPDGTLRGVRPARASAATRSATSGART